MKDRFPNAVIGSNVTIGEGCEIGYGVVIHDDTVIGDNVRIDDYAVVGKLPMKAANSAVTKECELPPCKIGSGVIIGTSAVIYRGCEIGDKVLIADLGTVRERVTIGNMTIIGRGATVECDTTVGMKCKIQTNVYLTAYSTVEDFCFVGPCVTTSNDNFAGRTEKRFDLFKGLTLKKGGRIGAGSTILPGKVIGEDAFVAAGSVVTKDVAPRTIVMGNPARYFKDVDEEQLLENQ